MKGITIYVCFGKWGGFHIVHNKKTTFFRLVLGFVSIAILNVDIEVLLTFLQKGELK